MNFHRSLAHPEICRHYLVGLAASHEIEDLALARRERISPLLNTVLLTELRAIAAVFFQSALHAIQEVLVAEGLLQEVERALLHGFYGHGNVAMPGDEDHWNDGTTQVEELL